MQQHILPLGVFPRKVVPPVVTIPILPPITTSPKKIPPTNTTLKCSKCKSRPKSGSGSSLCIRCKLQRDYGSPRGGFAAPRKKPPPPSTMALVKTEKLANQANYIRLELEGHPPRAVSYHRICSQCDLTESSLDDSLRASLESEHSAFEEEDLDRKLRLGVGGTKGGNVALPAELTSPTRTLLVRAPQPTTTQATQSHTTPQWIVNARTVVKQYTIHLEAALEALESSSCDSKWILVQSVFQKRSVLDLIIAKLNKLHAVLLPQHQSKVTRLSRTADHLFNSMLLRAVSEIAMLNVGIPQPSPQHQQPHYPSCSSSPSPQQQPQQHPQQQPQQHPQQHAQQHPQQHQQHQHQHPQQHLSQHQHQQHPQQAPQVHSISPHESLHKPSPPPLPPPPPQPLRGKTLKEEADEEITKILAKLQSEDRTGTRQLTPELPLRDLPSSLHVAGSTSVVVKSEFEAYPVKCEFSRPLTPMGFLPQASPRPINPVIFAPQVPSRPSNPMPYSGEGILPHTVNPNAMPLRPSVAAPQLRNLLAKPVNHNHCYSSNMAVYSSQQAEHMGTTRQPQPPLTTNASHRQQLTPPSNQTCYSMSMDIEGTQQSPPLYNGYEPQPRLHNYNVNGVPVVQRNVYGTGGVEQVSYPRQMIQSPPAQMSQSQFHPQLNYNTIPHTLPANHYGQQPQQQQIISDVENGIVTNNGLDREQSSFYTSQGATMLPSQFPTNCR